VLKRLLGLERKERRKAPLHPLLESYRNEIERFDDYLYDRSPKDFEAGRAMLALEREEQAEILSQVLAEICRNGRESRRRFRKIRVMTAETIGFLPSWPDGFSILAKALLRRRLPFTEGQIVRIAADLAQEEWGSLVALPALSLVRVFENYASREPLPAAAADHLRELLGKFDPNWCDAQMRRIRARLEAVLEVSEEEEATIPLERGDVWADRLLDHLAGLPDDEQAAWRALLTHAGKATTAKPTRAWRTAARELLGAAKLERFPDTLKEVLAAIGQPGTRHTRRGEPRLLDDDHTDLLRGLVWCSALDDGGAPLAELAAAASECFKKVPDVGPLNVKVGNACVWAIAAGDEPAGVAALSALRAKVKHPSTRNQIDRILAEAADRLGLTPAELEETTVPDFEMVEVGELRREVGDHVAVLRVLDSSSVDLRWLKSSGQEQKSVPKEVKDKAPEELKAVRKLARAIKGALPGQRDRLERLFLGWRSWPLMAWRERYLDHPLVGTLARRLIWSFHRGDESVTAAWHDGELVDHDGIPVEDRIRDAEVSLWHPLDSPEGVIRAWRLWLYTHQVTQPFKQAHREIYLLTDAERETATYSNRFAAHILRQHQFAALCRQRGWRYSLQGGWDSHNVPYRTLEDHDLLIELWVDPAPAETSDMGIFLYVATDQVRFCDLAGEAQPLESVPPLLFSELMRDVDLFVGVASVGNDPEWEDRGEDGGFGNYWREYSFGDLSETAKTRREILERIVPRLRIADRCSFTDRFLVVKGNLKSYKIHCGSGNVMLASSGHYLCIVPGRSSVRGVDRPYLPFEGDGILAIILSKAFLLAADDRIEDRTIRSQIGL
jgi:hypothetical protein